MLSSPTWCEGDANIDGIQWGTGSLAAAFQSFMYAGFTPAGGVFATLTSMAMLGSLMPVAVILAILLATVVAAFVYVCGVGR